MRLTTPGTCRRALVRIVAFAILAFAMVAMPFPRTTSAAISTVVDEPPVPQPEEVIERLRETYSTTSVRERVTVMVRRRDNAAQGTAGERRRKSVLFVQLQPELPASEGAKARPKRAWVRAGNLRVWTEGAMLRVATDAPDSPVFERELDDARAQQEHGAPSVQDPKTPPEPGPTPAPHAGSTCVDTASLARVLPALPLPQLDLWCPASARDPNLPALATLTHYARDIRWNTVARDARAGTLQLSGTCAGGSVTLLSTEKTSRLRRVTIELLDPSPVSITLDVAPEAIGTSATGGTDSAGLPPLFEIDPSTRRRVSSIAELALAVRQRAEARPIDWSSVQTIEGSSVRVVWKELPVEARPRIVLLARTVNFPAPSDPVVESESTRATSLPASVTAALARLRAHADDLPGPIWIVLDVCERSRNGQVDERVLATVEKLNAELAVVVAESRGRVLWTCESAWGQSLAPRDVTLAAALIDEQGVIVARLNAQGENPADGEALADEVLARLNDHP